LAAWFHAARLTILVNGCGGKPMTRRKFAMRVAGLVLMLSLVAVSVIWLVHNSDSIDKATYDAVQFHPPQFDKTLRPFEGKYIGCSEEQIVAELGRPNQRWNGHYGLPSLGYANQHPNAWTLVFHQKTGTQYVSVEEVNGKWICFSSNWLPKGAVF
jgi:hypothetical protein